MELIQYWTIVKSKWWAVLAVTLVALAASAVNAPRTVASYEASVRLAVRPVAEVSNGNFYTYDGYYAYVASEYLNDDIGKVVESSNFMAALRSRAKRDYGKTPTGKFEVKKAHRVLMVEASSSSADDALLLVKVAAEMLSDPQERYFESLTGKSPQVTLVEDPQIVSSTPASRVWVDIAVRTLLGLLVGLALAFLLDFLDDNVRGRNDLETITGWDVIGEIPAEGRRGVGQSGMA